jgi:hypothetical protein
MTEREAQEVTRMVESGWNVDFGIDGRRLWAQMLYQFDAELATMAVAEMSKHPLPANRSRPQVADLRGTILKIRADQAAKALPRQTTSREKGTPEWVFVWSWARSQRAPRCLVPFPQQDGFVEPDMMMSMAEYEKLRDEWLAAGGPKFENPIMLARA